MTTELLIESADVLKAAKRTKGDLTARVIQSICQGEEVQPAAGGGVQGHPRKFTVTQAVGILVVSQLRNGDRRCPTQYAVKIVAAFGSMTEKELLRMFAEDGTALVMIHGATGLPILRPKQFDWPDVKQAYDLVRELLPD